MDTPMVTAVLTQYDEHAVQRRCGKVYVAPPPTGAGEAGTVTYGPNLQAWCVFLLVMHHVPVERCAGIIEALTGTRPSDGFVHGMLARAARAVRVACMLNSALVKLVCTWKCGIAPPPGAVWRGGGTWSPGLIIVHNDAATYNAAWHQGKLTGFFDWGFAGPATPEWDLALAAFSWVPLHTRNFVAAEGFTDFAARPRRLERFLRTYGWSGTTGEFLGVVEARIKTHADGIRGSAASGDEAFGRLLHQGVPDALDQAIAELASFQ